MEKLFIWKSQKFSYLKRGKGNIAVLCFHGYGLNAASWNVFSSLDQERFCWYQFDLPFHGKTEVESGFAFDPDELCNWLEAFMAFEKIQGKAHLLSFSLGGNFALALGQYAAEKVASVSLIAADGIAPKPGFQWLTLSKSGHVFFRWFIRNGKWWVTLIRVMERLRFLPSRVANFYIANIDSREKRVLLFKRWCSVAKLRVDLDQWVLEVNAHEIPVIMLFSRNDRVIPIKPAKKLADELKHVSFIERMEGHQLMQRHIAQLWLEAINGFL